MGYNNIDITYAREKGIAVTNTPKAVNSPTAELALALMLSAARRIAECNQRIRLTSSLQKPLFYNYLINRIL